MIILYSQRVSYSFLNYLRTVLVPNYKETGLPDADQIMISCPRLIAYELLVIDFAIRLLEYAYKEHLCTKSTLEQDILALRNPGLSYEARTIMQFNVQTRQTVRDQIDLLKVLKALIQRVEVLEVEDAEGFASCLINKVSPYEDALNEEEMYRRRMRMGRYFKDLRMHIVQLKVSKAAKAKDGSAKKEKKAKSGKTGKKKAKK